MKRYSPAEIEPKWQQKWTEDGLYKAEDFSDKQKFVMLTEFPYPSGDGLHLGHAREYTLGDILARYKRMQGYNVLYPMGYDAFGLPTENYAIKNKIRPQEATDRNVANFQRQFERLGYSIDWSRSFRTTDPEYYRWTQWLFLQFYKHGLAYQDDIEINWCPKCKTGLANEEVVNGLHERCGTSVEKKQLKQWMLRITKYADKLIENLNTVDYPSRIADQQINWIGRSVGAEVDFDVKDSDTTITVFTTRPDTLFGATFMVLAPENELVQSITTPENEANITAYIKTSQAKSDIERQDTDREKTGVFTGAYAINPLNDELVPVWIADYVLAGYGTGAIMAVPAHDERDYEFAKKFDLPIKEVVAPDFGAPLPDAVDVTGPVVVGYDPNTKQFMSLINTKNQLRWFASGGLGDGETYEQAALRELGEEAGYHKVKKLIRLGGPTYSYYYNSNKNSNRRSFSYMYLAIIDSTERTEQALEAHEQFKAVWSGVDEILDDLNKEQASVGGVGHWIDCMSRVADVAKAYDKNLEYVGPMFSGDGVLFDSGPWSGIPSAEARELIVQHLQREGKGKEKVNYRLRDWIFSRQHYWGEPIPIVHCPEHGAVAVPDDQLPVTLPEVEFYEPSDTGESP
ncbi:leucine--tRNA ligase, partial [Candidatus Saccharibacteria bacterium]|nr:leucine--tRNA ligase [Candidatus Saccharibacteria bacterium]